MGFRFLKGVTVGDQLRSLEGSQVVMDCMDDSDFYNYIHGIPTGIKELDALLPQEVILDKQELLCET